MSDYKLWCFVQGYGETFSVNIDDPSITYIDNLKEEIKKKEQQPPSRDRCVESQALEGALFIAIGSDITG